jgi:hypothetical protein
MMALGRLLQSVGTLCVLASASAHAAGEFEAATKAVLVGMARDSYGDEGFPDARTEQSAGAAADCITSYVVDGFSPHELRNLDAVSSWSSLSKSMRTRILERLLDADIRSSCGFDFVL